MQRLIDIFSSINYPLTQITVFNANPEIDLTNYISKESLTNTNLINADKRKYMLHRYKLAYESNYNNFLLVDDDLFYTTGQINKLIEYYLAEPQFIHGGGFGQKIIYENGDLPKLERCYPYCDGFVDVIGRIYCFGRRHLKELKLLLDQLNLDFDFCQPGCDILLSFSGRPERRPKCHNLGRYKNCPTSDTSGIAVYKTDGFHKGRNELIKQICSVGYF
jgi:hypothetical protein